MRSKKHTIKEACHTNTQCNEAVSCLNLYHHVLPRALRLNVFSLVFTMADFLLWGSGKYCGRFDKKASNYAIIFFINIDYNLYHFFFIFRFFGISLRVLEKGKQ